MVHSKNVIIRQLSNIKKQMKPWSKVFAQTAQEFSLTTLPVISGIIPPELKGTVYCNGPGRFSRGQEKIGHWFDGDGAILAVHCNNQKAEATYQFVKTEGYLKEEKKDSYIYANYGMKAKGLFLNNLFKSVKNSANTSVLPLENKLLALWEGGNPYALTLDKLETKGEDNLGFLKNNQPFSAHPKIDPDTGNIFNFGVSISNNAILHLYQIDHKGKLIKQQDFKLQGFPLIHDFVLAGDYLIFFISPVRINLISVVSGINSYSDALEWKPELGTEILVFNKNDLSLVSRGETEAWFQWHYTNGYVEKDGTVIIELVRFEDFSINQFLQEVPTGKTETKAKGTLWQMRIDPQNAKMLEMNQLLDRGCEFPVIAPHKVGQQWRYTFLSVHRENIDISQEIFGTIGVFDHKSNTLSTVDWEENLYPNEPIFIPKPNQLEQGWILTLIYNANNDKSEVLIFDSNYLSAEPLCRLELPSTIPPGFHGKWKST